MGQGKITSSGQTTFLELLLSEKESDGVSGTLIETLVSAPLEESKPPNIIPTADEIADLFGFLSAIEKIKSDKITLRNPHAEQSNSTEANGTNQGKGEKRAEGKNSSPTFDTKQDEFQSSSSITHQWLLDNHRAALVRIAAIYNSMREFEGLALQENAEEFLAAQLAQRLHVSNPETDVEIQLSECHRILELLTRRLYGSASNESSDEVNRYTETMMENALHQPYEDEAQWIRQAIEVAVRKCVADPSKQIYTTLVGSTLLRPFRLVVRQLLQANELPFPKRVLAQARESDYAKMMRESLQTLARLGLTAQTTTLAWETAWSDQSENTLTPWLARRVDGAIAAIWKGQAIVEHRVVRTSGYALLATFDADKHITHQTTIAEDDIERAKQSLLAQGYRCGESAYPQDNRVVKLWCEFCRGRDSGWWFGDEMGRVMVVIPYLMRRRLSYHKPLCRAVSQMQAWGYRFYYDDHTLYFLPNGVELPANAFRNGDVAEHKGGG